MQASAHQTSKGWSNLQEWEYKSGSHKGLGAEFAEQGALALGPTGNILRQEGNDMKAMTW